jgi:ABC-2 type transport system permease protein
MKPLIKAEVRKLLTTRTAYGLLIGMLILAGPGIFLAGSTGVAELSRPLQDQVWFFVAAGFTRLLVVVLGIRSVTDEYGYGTIVPSLLVSPDRRRLLAAKAITAGVAGLVFTLLAEALMVAVAAGVAVARGADLTITSTSIRALTGMALAGLLWAVIGVAIGAIVRRQIPAIVGSLFWLMPGGGLEAIIGDQLGSSIRAYLPGNEGMALALAADPRGLLWGALVLTGYAAVLMVAGAFLMRRRDVAP